MEDRAPADRSALAEEPHILVVDDDRRLRQLLSKYLNENGFRVTTAADAAQARGCMRGLDFDLLVLDLMMPGESGLDFAQSMRGETMVPILMLTAMGETEDRINGLERGADDYLVKPFECEVLLARARAVLRRAEPSPERSGPLTFQDDHLAFDLSRRAVAVRGQPVNLTKTECSLLECLVSNADHLMTVQQILACVWGPQYVDSIAYVHVYIHRLRHKLEPDPDEPRYLLNVPGSGYLFCTKGMGKPRS
jgi:two-component system phosphate regulon response regulator OmpR